MLHPNRTGQIGRCAGIGLRLGFRVRQSRWLNQQPLRLLGWLWLVLAAASWMPTGISAEPPGGKPSVSETTVQLNFPAEIEIQGLVDYVSERAGVKILYDEQIAQKKLSIKAPGEIPVSSLLDLLESALKMKGLVLVDAEVAGWKRIVTNQKLAEIAQATESAAAVRGLAGTTAVTQVFTLKHFDAQQFDQIIKPFLTQPGANSIVLREQNLLIVTDYAANVVRVGELVTLIDQPKPDVRMEFYTVRNVNASDLAQKLTTLLSAKAKAQGLAAETSTGVEVVHDERTQQVMLVGQRTQVDSVLELARNLDAPTDVTTMTYEIAHASAERIDRLAQAYVETLSLEQPYRSMVTDNLLIATTTARVHQYISQLRTRWDSPEAKGPSPVRFYRLKNVTVTELLETLRGIEGRQGSAPDVRPARSVNLSEGLNVPGPNRSPLPQQPLQPLPAPPAVREPAAGPVAVALPEGPGAELTGGLLRSRAHLTADVHSNTLIVVAEPDVQLAYAELIDALDRRRPQVLIEAKVVVIDTTDDFTLGVEVSGGDRGGLKRLFAFSSFGLSKVDPISGALALVPGVGFNGTLVNPDVADAIVRALATHRRARVLSAPRLVVNDNAEGALTSVAEVPFTSVNASQTVATTSFAGFAEAGTTITVIPTIGEGDHLQLEYTITLNSFTGAGGDGIPPPRQTDEIKSKLTVPDGHTVIVGGLNQVNRTSQVDSLPFLEKIPIVKHLTSLQTRHDRHSSLFVFLRPVILRDDKFRDLKFISGQDAQCAGLPGRFPYSGPLAIK